MVTISVLVHPRVLLARQGQPWDGHYVLVGSGFPLWNILTELATEMSVDTLLELIEEISAEDVRATLHFTAGSMAQIPDLPSTYAPGLGEYPSVQAPRFPSHARLRGCQTPIAEILAFLGTSLDVRATLERFVLSNEELAVALRYAALFHHALRGAMLDKVDQLRGLRVDNSNEEEPMTDLPTEIQ